MPGVAQRDRVSAYSIIYEDESLLVANKPAGWSVTRRADGRTGGDVLLDRLQLDGHENLTPTHRIDDEVSGLLACAKSKSALDFMSGQFQSKTAERVYRGLAVVATPEEIELISNVPAVRTPADTLPDTFEVSYALAPDQHVAGRMHVYRRKGGRPAHTRVRVLESFGRFVWFEARPATSRHMQVQAHMAAIGAPVLGDAAHGLPEVELRLSSLKRGYKGRETEKSLIEGLALVAAELTLRHPESKEAMTFVAELPVAFEIALRNLRKFTRRQNLRGC